MELKEEIRSVVAQMLEIDDGDIGDNDLYADKGMDSFMALELVSVIEDKFGIYIDEELLPKMKSINETAAVVEVMLENKQRK